MIERLFVRRPAIARHQEAPFFRERAQFLESLLAYGANRRHVQAKATRLVQMVRRMNLTELRPVSAQEIEHAAKECALEIEQRTPGKAREECLYGLSLAAKHFFLFHGLLAEDGDCRPAFHDECSGFLRHLREARGQSPTSIQRHSKALSQFLNWLGERHNRLDSTQLTDLDAYLEYQRGRGLKPRTINNFVATLQCFFRYLSDHGIFVQTFARGIQPSIEAKAHSLPQGPKWSDVRRLLKSAKGSAEGDIRDRAILLLLSVYGLRASEVSNMLLDDFDWANETFVVRRVKRGAIQQFPIQYEFGEAIVRYLKTVRPRCSCREVFVTRYAPFRRVDPTAMRPMIWRRLRALNIKSEHQGPHTLRHACATQLLRRGFSLREIADFLGHKNIASVQIYAKHDMKALRRVADFSLGTVR